MRRKSFVSVRGVGVVGFERGQQQEEQLAKEKEEEEEEDEELSAESTLMITQTSA